MNRREIGMACAALMVLVWGCGGSTKTEAGNASAGASNSATNGGSSGAGASGSPSSVGAGSDGLSAGDAGAGGDAGMGGDAGAPPAGISGTWKGYVENYSFSDKSDAITLDIVSGPNGVSGHATFGMSPPPPPVTDPTVGYPPGVDPDFTSAYPGFPFTIENALLEGSRLQFDISTAEMWKTWCEAQTPIADETNAGFYGCTHNWATNYGAPCSQLDPMTMQWVPVDCGRVRLCTPGMVCQCTAKACDVSLTGGIHFDLNVSLPKADGSVSGLDANLHNVHLTKG